MNEVKPGMSEEWRRHLAAELKGTRETRSFDASFELRDSISSDGTPVVTGTGYASVFSNRYDMGRGRTEEIAPGSFRGTLSEDPAVALLANHEGLPLASTQGGSLTLEEDERGLKFTARMDASDPDVDRVVRKVRRGDLTGASFAFRVTDDVFSEDGAHRLIRGVDLAFGDVSICVTGANPLASVSVRSAAEAARRPLRDHSRRQRERLASLRGSSSPGPQGVLVTPVHEEIAPDRYRRRLDELRGSNGR
jgi:uncharacterized protein